MARNATHVAGNVAAVGLSAIKDMAMRAAKLDGVASLSWGLPSFRTPDHIRHAVAEALAADPDIGKYALPDGLPELRALVAEQHLAKTGVAASPDANVFMAPEFAQSQADQFDRPAHDPAFIARPIADLPGFSVGQVRIGQLSTERRLHRAPSPDASLIDRLKHQRLGMGRKRVHRKT